MRYVLGKNCKGNHNIHFIFNNVFLENHAVSEVVWKTIVEPDSHRWQYGGCAFHAA